VVDVTTLDVTVTLRGIERRSPVQHPAIVDDQHVTGVETKLDLIRRVVEELGQPSPTPVVDIEHIWRHRRSEIEPRRESEMTQLAVSIQFDDRCRGDLDVGTDVVPKLDIELAEDRYGLWIDGPQRLDRCKPIGHRRIAAGGIVDEGMQELQTGNRRPIWLIGMCRQGNRCVGEITRIGFVLHIEQRAEVRRRHPSEAARNVEQRTRCGRRLAHHEEPVHEECFDRSPQSGRIVDLGPVDRRKIHVGAAPGDRSWQPFRIWSTPTPHHDGVEIEPALVKVGELDHEMIALDPSIHGGQIGVEVVRLVQPLAVRRVDLTRSA